MTDKIMGSGTEDAKVQALDISGLMECLPHRYPFLLVDRIVRMEGKKCSHFLSR